MMKKKQTSLISIILMALLTAIALVIQYFQFPLPLMPPFLQVDLSDIPALIGALVLGPWSGVLIEALKNLLHWLLTGSMTGVPIGEASNFLAGGLFVLVTAVIHKRFKSLGGLIAALVIGNIVMSVVMMLANYYLILPAYAYFLGYSIPDLVALSHGVNHAIDSMLTLVVVGILPFNLIKGLIITLVFIPIYYRLVPRLMPKQRSI